MKVKLGEKGLFVLAFVRFLVKGQIIGLGKTFIAAFEGTDVRFFPGVDSDMSFQVEVQGKALMTKQTSERLHTCMH